MKNKEPINEFFVSEELNIDAKALYVSDKLETLLVHFKSKAANAKQLFYWYKYSSIILTAITTIVASLHVLYDGDIPKWILPVFSALSTISVTLLGASSAQAIWTSSKTTQQRLQAEKLLFLEASEKYKDKNSREERLQLFSEQLVYIWNQGHNRWEQGVMNA